MKKKLKYGLFSSIVAGIVGLVGILVYKKRKNAIKTEAEVEDDVEVSEIKPHDSSDSFQEEETTVKSDLA